MYPVTLKTCPSLFWLLSSSAPPFPFAPQKHQLLPITLWHLCWFSADLLPQGPEMDLTLETGMLLSFFPPFSFPVFLTSFFFISFSLLFLFSLIFLVLTFLSPVSQTKYKWKSSSYESLIETESMILYQLDMLIEHLLVISRDLGSGIGRGVHG